MFLKAAYQELKFFTRLFLAHLTGRISPLTTTQLPFCCIITPAFDQALPAVKLLVTALQKQTESNFLHIIISNGSEPRLKKYFAKLSKNDPRFKYVVHPVAPTNNPSQLLMNIGQRRDFALKKFEAQRYWFVDADFKLTNRRALEFLHQAHRRHFTDIFLIQSQKGQRRLPIYPYRVAEIDMSNFTFSRRVAKTFSYPANLHQTWRQTGFINDFRFFKRISTPSNTRPLPIMAGIINGNQLYKSLTADQFKKFAGTPT